MSASDRDNIEDPKKVIAYAPREVVRQFLQAEGVHTGYWDLHFGPEVGVGHQGRLQSRPRRSHGRWKLGNPTYRRCH